MQFSRRRLWFTCLFVTLCVTGLSVSQALAEAVSRQTFTLPMGPHTVGFQSRQETDPSRLYWVGSHSPPDAQFRPMHVHLWYPAASHRGSPMQYGDYVSLYLQDEGSGQHTGSVVATTPRAALSRLSRDWRLPGEAPDSELQALTPAWRNAPPASGRFPLIIYAPSLGGVAWENSVLCEYLASHGYVVLAVPSQGERSGSITRDVVGLEAQVRDIEWLIGYAASLPFVERSQLAVMGWSFGGLAAVLAKTRRDDIRAIVELDGSIGDGDHYKERFLVYPGASEKRIDVPLIFLQEATVAGHSKMPPELAPERAGQPPEFFQKLEYSDALWVRMGQLMHEEFSSAGHRIERPPLLEAARKDPSSTNSWHEIPAASRGYEIVASYALQFLEAHVRRSAAARDWLAVAPSAHGFGDTEVVAVVRRQARGSVPRVATFASEVKAMTPEALWQAYQARQQADASYRLPPEEVAAWADGLARGNRLEEALAVLQFDATVQGHNVESLMQVVGMAIRAGQRELGITTLKKVLEQDPANAGAARWLEKLMR